MSLSDTQYQEIMMDYDRTRDANRHLLERRRELVYSRIPEIRSLEDSIGTLALERTRRLLGLTEESEPSEEPAGDALHRISLRRRALLRANGYPEDYLEPVYTCRDCKDTGYITTSNGLQSKCSCFRQREIALLYENSNFSGVRTDDTFANLSYRYCTGEDLDRLKKAATISRDFVTHFHEKKGNLLFFGTVGTGKSFLSGCIANELLRQGYSVVYFTAVGLFDTLARYSFDGKDKESLYNFSKDLYNNDLVIVDDLGTELLSSFVASQLFSLLNERSLRGKATIISTNLNLSELRDRYSDRVFSRISDGFTICKLTGPDVRMCQKLHQQQRNE